jgi:hypothetical protein
MPSQAPSLVRVLKQQKSLIPHVMVGLLEVGHMTEAGPPPVSGGSVITPTSLHPPEPEPLPVPGRPPPSLDVDWSKRSDDAAPPHDATRSDTHATTHGRPMTLK